MTHVCSLTWLLLAPLRERICTSSWRRSQLHREDQNRGETGSSGPGMTRQNTQHQRRVSSGTVRGGSSSHGAAAPTVREICRRARARTCSLPPSLPSFLQKRLFSQNPFVPKSQCSLEKRTNQKDFPTILLLLQKKKMVRDRSCGASSSSLETCFFSLERSNCVHL